MIPSNVPRTHLARLLAGCALVMQLVACDFMEPPIGEPQGSADYFLDNRTDRSLTIDWTSSSALGTEARRAGPVHADQVLAFESDGIIGVNPTPVHTFASLRLLDEAGNVVYRQEPIDDGAWIVERTDDYDYGHANITLVITTAMLAPDGAGAAD